MSSREIKFRAWDNLQKKYEYWDAKNDKYDGIFWSMIRRPEFEEPEQFTGLKDKNGKEIFEGDIIDTGQGIAVIEWNPNGSWCIRKADGSFYDLQYWECEIIGTIHDNPELLGD